MNYFCNDIEMYSFFDQIARGEIDLKNYPNAKYLLELTNNTFVFDCNSEINTGKLYRNMRRIIDDISAKEQVYLVNNLQKIFRKYICIDGLERLLATNYTDIEWSMFLEYDFNNEKSQFYRDHFIHQFRDAYLAFTLLNNNELHLSFKKWYLDQKSTLSVYIKKMLESYLKNIEEKDRENQEEILFYIIIYKSILLAAVFHDLGYPISHFARVSKQIDRSLSFHRSIFQTHKTNFQHIRSKLATSLLFRSVKIEDIEKKYEINDHGALSAICYLLNFYETSAIKDLPNIERCIIELSAYSIYDHTNKYNNNNRMTFFENPISYLLRICDDLQEWSRFNISMDTNNNAMIHTESLKTIFTEDNNTYKILVSDKPETIFLKTTNIYYKKLNFIDACNYLNINDKEYEIIININYNKYALLEIASLNYNYALYRNEELKKLKKMFTNQIYIPKIDIEYILSNNIFFLANEILEDLNEKLKIISIENLINEKKIELNSPENIENDIRLVTEKIEYEFCKNSKFRKPFLYYNLEQKKVDIDSEKETFISTLEYSNYCIASQGFLRESIGFLGLANLLCL